MTRMTGSTRHEATARRLVALACGLVLAVVPSAEARLGDLDPSFDGDGIATPNVAGTTLEDVTARPTGEPVAVFTSSTEAVSSS
jgi:hypothetical protein